MYMKIGRVINGILEQVTKERDEAERRVDQVVQIILHMNCLKKPLGM